MTLYFRLLYIYKKKHTPIWKQQTSSQIYKGESLALLNCCIFLHFFFSTWSLRVSSYFRSIRSYSASSPLFCYTFLTVVVSLPSTGNQILWPLTVTRFQPNLTNMGDFVLREVKHRALYHYQQTTNWGNFLSKNCVPLSGTVLKGVCIQFYKFAIHELWINSVMLPDNFGCFHPLSLLALPVIQTDPAGALCRQSGHFYTMTCLNQTLLLITITNRRDDTLYYSVPSWKKQNTKLSYCVVAQKGHEFPLDENRVLYFKTFLHDQLVHVATSN